MLAVPLPLLGVCVAALVVRLLVSAWKRGRHCQPPYPPGPRGLPVIGNLYDLPGKPEWVTFRDWSKQHGSDILYMDVLGQRRVILNTLQASTDLLTKRSAIYSDRPRMLMVNELCGLGWTIGTTAYTSTWKARRKVFHMQFHPAASLSYRPFEEKISRRLLRHLLDSPDRFMSHVQLVTGALIIELAYGIVVKDHDNPYLSIAHQAMVCSAEGVNTVYLVDIFPFLRHIPSWFPGAKFRRQAKEWNKYIVEMLHGPYNAFKERAARGDAPDCVAARMVADSRKSNLDAKAAEETDGHIEAALASMFIAGAETSYASVTGLILAITLFPEVQVKAQAEIDRVCGDRLPTFDDYESLPYIQAVVKETLRWQPVIPESIPHATTEDDIYQGYYIPKGTVVVPNCWGILQDDSIFPDPTSFNPDRFMKDGAFNTELLDPAIAAFGFGRRICPGRDMAQDSMWIMSALILAVFNIQKAKDASGNPITPSGEYHEGALRHPRDFVCDIRPRSDWHKNLVLATAADDE